jgi:hypothetical protein
MTERMLPPDITPEEDETVLLTSLPTRLRTMTPGTVGPVVVLLALAMATPMMGPNQEILGLGFIAMAFFVMAIRFYLAHRRTKAVPPHTVTDRRVLVSLEQGVRSVPLGDIVSLAHPARSVTVTLALRGDERVQVGCLTRREAGLMAGAITHAAQDGGLALTPLAL